MFRISKIVSVFIILTGIFILFSVSAQAGDSLQWNGWRGLEKEGIYSAGDLPVEWSSDKNIKWKTPVPGSGHSSPVIYGENIVVTTAYETDQHSEAIQLFQSAILVISILVFILFVLQLKNINLPPGKQGLYLVSGLLIQAFLLGFILFYSLTGNVFRIPENSEHITRTYRWFYSGAILALSTLVSAYSFRAKGIFQIVFGIVLLSIGGFLILFRPFPEYYPITGDHFMVETIQKVLAYTIAVGTGLFVVIMLKKFRRGKALAENLKTKRWTRWILLALTGIAFLTGLYSMGLYRWVIYHIPAGTLYFPEPDLYYRDGYIFIRILGFSTTLWFVYLLFFESGKVLGKQKFFSASLILLALLMFAEKNYLHNEKTYTRAVVCLEKETGSVKWTREMFAAEQQDLHPDNSPASPTPIITKNRIFAYFGSPGLACLNFDGEILWQRNDLIFEGIHGVGASPMYADGKIVILNDMSKAPSISVIDAETGITIWHKDRIPWEGLHGAHRTPSIYSSGDTTAIITWGKHGLSAYELESGIEINSFDLKSNGLQLIASIVSNGDTLFAPDQEYMHAFSLSGFLNDREMLLWSVEVDQRGPNCSSPVYYNGMLFMISENGFASCMDASSGEIVWREKLTGRYMASVLCTGSYVYFSSTDGLTTVCKAGSQYTKIAENYLGEGLFASFAPSDGEIFARTTQHVWCISQK